MVSQREFGKKTMDLCLNSNPHTEWEKVVDWGRCTNGKGVVYKQLLVSCHGELQSSSLPYLDSKKEKCP